MPVLYFLVISFIIYCIIEFFSYDSFTLSNRACARVIYTRVRARNYLRSEAIICSGVSVANVQALESKKGKK